MMAFNPKRTPAAELARLVETEAGGALPVTTPRAAAVGQSSKPRAEQMVQINFRASASMAKLIATLAEREGGSTRTLFARLLAAAGHPVPDGDLNPQASRRRYD